VSLIEAHCIGNYHELVKLMLSAKGGKIQGGRLEARQ